MNEHNLVWRLLRKNISIGQIAGYALANLVGLAIVMTAVQFYRDADNWLGGDRSENNEFITVSKRVGTFGLADTRLSQADTDSLMSQPWVKDVGSFTASQFNVNASVDFNGSRMSTALFFESVPDRFLDIRPHSWNFKEGDTEIPVILSKDYLSLYNFGFASARGLPTVSEAMIGMVPLQISISGNGRQQYFRGRIVGFSSRLNTIAVPEQFMKWANSTFGDSSAGSPSRLIVEVSKPGDPAIRQYLDDHDFDTANGADSSQNRFVLSVLTSVVAAVGAVICLLSLFILMLSLYLLMQKNREKLHNLMLLGYTPGSVASNYRRLVAAVNLAVFAGATAVTLTATSLWRGPLEQMGGEPVSTLPTVFVGLAIIAIVTAINIVTVNHSVRRWF